MYIPNSFREDQLPVLHAFIRQYSFSTLISHEAGDLQVTHLPLLLDPAAGPYGTLRGHVARANPHWKSFRDGVSALAIFHGPHAYISPAWYESPVNVPTWNYAVVHAHGTPRTIEEGPALRQIVEEMVRTYESPREAPWTMDLPGDYLENMLKAIVGIEIPIDRLEGKFKLNQNRSGADQRAVIEALREGPGADLAEWMDRAAFDRR